MDCKMRRIGVGFKAEPARSADRGQRERVYIHTVADDTPTDRLIACTGCGATGRPLAVLDAVPSATGPDVACLCRECVTEALVAFDDPDVGTDAYLGVA